MTFLSQLFTKQLFSVVNLKKIDIFKFNKDIADAFSNVENLDLDSPRQFFNLTLTLILDKHASLKTVTVIPRNKNPWFTPYLLISERRKRRQLERTWHNSRDETDKLLYQNQCHLYNSLVKKPSLITFHLCLKTVQIQNLCGVQSTKFVIAQVHSH